MGAGSFFCFAGKNQCFKSDEGKLQEVNVGNIAMGRDKLGRLLW